jgi:hypothetical protein
MSTGERPFAPTKLYFETFELTAEELEDGATVITTATTTVELPPAASALTVEIKELPPEELPEIAWASTTTSTVWQIDIKRKPPLAPHNAAGEDTRRDDPLGPPDSPPS